MGHNPYHPPDFDNVTIIGGSLIVKLPRKVKKTSFFEIFKRTRTYRDKNPTATIRRIEVKDAEGQLRFAFEPEDGRCSVNVNYERVGGGPPTFRLWLKWMLAGRPSLESEPEEPHSHAGEGEPVSAEPERSFVNADGRPANLRQGSDHHEIHRH